jgi:hypothetical protein
MFRNALYDHARAPDRRSGLGIDYFAGRGIAPRHGPTVTISPVERAVPAFLGVVQDAEHCVRKVVAADAAVIDSVLAANMRPAF